MSMRVQPTFIGIGFQRCGTSWLNRILWEHPEIGKPEGGLHFFNNNLNRGVEWYENQLASLDPGTGIVGEFSTTYCYPHIAKDVAATIHAYYPGAKIVASIRHPMARAVSDYRRLLRIGEIQDPRISFSQAIDCVPDIIERSLYAQILREYVRRFPRERLHVIIYDDIERDAHSVVRRLYRFLGVEESFVPQSMREERIGATYAMKSVRAERSLRVTQSVGRALSGWLPNRARRQIRHVGRKITLYIRELNRANGGGELWKDTIPQAVADRVYTDLEETAELAGIDLSDWQLK